MISNDVLLKIFILGYVLALYIWVWTSNWKTILNRIGFLIGAALSYLMIELIVGIAI